MSRTLSMNSGSRLSLKAWLRCGCREKARQMRLMLLWLSPATWARERVDQWVAAGDWLSKGARQHAFDFGIAQAAPGAGMGFIEQPIEAQKQEAFSPLAHRCQRDPYPASDLGIVPPLGAEQHDAGAQGQGLRCLGTARPLQQLLSFGGDQSQGRERATESHAASSCLYQTQEEPLLITRILDSERPHKWVSIGA